MESFKKRQKEMQRLERQREKAARRMERKQNREGTSDNTTSDEDAPRPPADNQQSSDDPSTKV